MFPFLLQNHFASDEQEIRGFWQVSGFVVWMDPGWWPKTHEPKHGLRWPMHYLRTGWWSLQLMYCVSDCWQTEPWEYFRLSQWAKLEALICSENPNGSPRTRPSQSSSHDLWPPTSTHAANQKKRGEAKQDCMLDCQCCFNVLPNHIVKHRGNMRTGHQNESIIKSNTTDWPVSMLLLDVLCVCVCVCIVDCCGVDCADDRELLSVIELN